MDIALAADDFIRHGTYLRNWSPRTVATYRTGISALCRAVGNAVSRAYHVIDSLPALR